ncbi:MAG: low molecular weight phosphatase family protein [Euryarchaeota archaeon]|nr:low molecular weight phosphatase family protein [Euryarchaeota archaeon]
MKLLFVCVGNTCRSQMAEAIARDLGFTAASAGTNPGTVVAANSLIVLEEIGVNSDGLRPKSVDEIETEGWDKIISMGCGVHCPMLPIAEDWELEDPVGQPLEVYRNTRDEIKRRLDMLKNDS